MRLRLGKTARLVLGIGIFVIVFATLWVVYSRQSSEQERLQKSLAGAGTQLTKFISEKDALASQLTQQQSQLVETQSLLSKEEASFPKLAASIEYDEILSEIADDNNLQVMSMTAAMSKEQKVQDITYLVISFEVKVKGEVNAILSMVSDITKDERLISASVELVDIKVSEASGEEEAPTSVGTIKFVGYGYGG